MNKVSINKGYLTDLLLSGCGFSTGHNVSALGLIFELETRYSLDPSVLAYSAVPFTFIQKDRKLLGGGLCVQN